MKWFKALIFLSVLVFLVLFIRSTDTGKVVASLQKVGYRFILILLTTFVAYLLATFGWRYCFGKEGEDFSITRLFFIRHIGEMVSLVNPTGIVGGEALKIYLINKKEVAQQTVITSILISRLLMMITQLFMFFVAFVLMLFTPLNFKFSMPAGYATYTFIVVACLLILWYVSTAAWFKNFIRLFKISGKMASYKTRLQSKLVAWRTNLTDFYRTNKKAVAWAAFYFTAHWIIGAAEFYFILVFLGLKISLLQALLIDMGVTVFKAAGVFVPGQLGIEEYGNKVMLSLVGIYDSEVWLTASILRRSRQLFWIAFGMAAYLFIHRRVMAIAH